LNKSNPHKKHFPITVPKGKMGKDLSKREVRSKGKLSKIKGIERKGRVEEVNTTSDFSGKGTQSNFGTGE